MILNVEFALKVSNLTSFKHFIYFKLILKKILHNTTFSDQLPYIAFPFQTTFWTLYIITGFTHDLLSTTDRLLVLNIEIQYFTVEPIKLWNRKC